MLPVAIVTSLAEDGVDGKQQGFSADYTDYIGLRVRSRSSNYPTYITDRTWGLLLDVPVTASPNILLATPTPEVEDVVLPTPQNVSLLLRDRDNQSFDRLLTAVFGIHSSRAFSVADCEMGAKLSAGYDPFELNQTAVGSNGEVSLWQIHPVHFWKYDSRLLQMDLEYAAQAAWELSGYGSNWTTPWRICG